eukprot:5599045-Amphidinium_carterae.1
MQDQFQTMQMQVQQQNAELQRQVTELNLAQTQATPLGTATPGVNGKHLTGIRCWAPDFFKGDTTEWRQWNSKFCAFVGAMHGGQVGEQSKSNSAFKSVLGAGSEAEAAVATRHAAFINQYKSTYSKRSAATLFCAACSLQSLVQALCGRSRAKSADYRLGSPIEGGTRQFTFPASQERLAGAWYPEVVPRRGEYKTGRRPRRRITEKEGEECSKIGVKPEFYAAVKSTSYGLSAIGMFEDLGVFFNEPLLVQMDATAGIAIASGRGA